MSEELFTRKTTARDILAVAEKKLEGGLFLEALEDLETIMEMDFNFPKLYEITACVKFWLNRKNKIESLKDSDMELALFLDFSYKGFIEFCKGKSIDLELEALKSIHRYIYKEIVHLMTYKDFNMGAHESKDTLILLGIAFIELEAITDALKTFDYLRTILPYNGECAFFLSELYHRVGNEKASKVYLRDALFYGVLEMPTYYMTVPLIYEIRSIIEKRGLHNSSAEEINSWMSAYSELMNVLDAKRAFHSEEEILLRRTISKLEVDHRKIKLRPQVAPKLLACYAWLVTGLIIADNEEDADEIAILGRKMALIDKELVQYYIKILGLER